MKSKPNDTLSLCLEKGWGNKMYKLEGSAEALHYLLANDYPSWAIDAIDNTLSYANGTYNKYEIISQFKVYDNIDALVYDFSLSINFDSINYLQWDDEICLALGDYLVLYSDGMYLINLGEQY